MIIIIKTVNRKELSINVQKGDEIRSVIEKIKDQGDSDFKGVSDLILKGDKMDKDKTLDEYGIVNNTTLICVGCINKGYRAEESYKDSGFNGQTTTGFLIDDLIIKILENPVISGIFKAALYTPEIPEIPEIDVGETRPASVMVGSGSGKKSKKKNNTKKEEKKSENES